MSAAYSLFLMRLHCYAHCSVCWLQVCLLLCLGAGGGGGEGEGEDTIGGREWYRDILYCMYTVEALQYHYRIQLCAV